MKVKIIRCPHDDWWYNHLVGEVVEVKDWYGKEYELIGEDRTKHCIDGNGNLRNIARISQEHCEVVQ